MCLLCQICLRSRFFVVVDLVRRGTCYRCDHYCYCYWWYFLAQNMSDLCRMLPRAQNLSYVLLSYPIPSYYVPLLVYLTSYFSPMGRVSVRHVDISFEGMPFTPSCHGCSVVQENCDPPCIGMGSRGSTRPAVGWVRVTRPTLQWYGFAWLEQVRFAWLERVKKHNVGLEPKKLTKSGFLASLCQDLTLSYFNLANLSPHILKFSVFSHRRHLSQCLNRTKLTPVARTLKGVQILSETFDSLHT